MHAGRARSQVSTLSNTRLVDSDIAPPQKVPPCALLILHQFAFGERSDSVEKVAVVAEYALSIDAIGRVTPQGHKLTAQFPGNSSGINQRVCYRRARLERSWGVYSWKAKKPLRVREPVLSLQLR